MHFLTDPAWLAVIVGAFAVIIPTFIPILYSIGQRNHKEITYDILFDLPLLNKHISKSILNEIEIYWKNKSIINPRILLIAFRNSGNVAITPEEYSDPITIIFKGKTEVMAANVVETQPSYLEEKVSLTLEADKVIMKPILLNKNYAILVSFLLNNFDNEYEVGALIKDVDLIKRFDPKSRQKRFNTMRIAVFSGIIILGSLLPLSVILPPSIFTFPFTSNKELLFGGYLLIYLLIIIYAYFLLSKRFLRRG